MTATRTTSARRTSDAHYTGPVVDAEPLHRRAVVAADVRRRDDEVVDAVVQRLRVEPAGHEPDQVETGLHERVVRAEHRHVLVRATRVDLPERVRGGQVIADVVRRVPWDD